MWSNTIILLLTDPVHKKCPSVESEGHFAVSTDVCFIWNPFKEIFWMAVEIFCNLADGFEGEIINRGSVVHGIANIGINRAADNTFLSHLEQGFPRLFNNNLQSCNAEHVNLRVQFAHISFVNNMNVVILTELQLFGSMYKGVTNNCN